MLNIIRSLKGGNLYAGSDGSVKNKIGSHTFVFTSGNMEGTIWGGAAITPRSHEEMSSPRAEHNGATSILSIISAIHVLLGDQQRIRHEVVI